MKEQAPYLADNNRSGATHGEAIFGDKQAQFNLPPEAEGLTAAGENDVAFVGEVQKTHANTPNNIASLAARDAVEVTEYANQYRDDIDQDRLDKITAQRR